MPTFVIVDDVEENRFLLSKTLLRKFPRALLIECQDSGAAYAAAQRQPTAIVVHRASDIDGVSLVRALRQLNVPAPIIVVSGRESFPEAMEAGAQAFLNYEAWLRIGTVVEGVIARGPAQLVAKIPFSTRTDSPPGAAIEPAR